jgi:hypothetical protein
MEDQRRKHGRHDDREPVPPVVYVLALTLAVVLVLGLSTHHARAGGLEEGAGLASAAARVAEKATQPRSD